METLYRKGAPPVERCLASAFAKPTARRGSEAGEGPPPTDPCTLLAALARQALIAEAELTPKPGLVDRRGPGAHSDMSLDRMRRSAEAIEPFFARMSTASATNPIGSFLREELGSIGREAERAMFATTGGVNTHKGAIWVLGLLVAAASRSTVSNQQTLTEIAGLIARIPDVARPHLLSHGDIVRDRYGV